MGYSIVIDRFKDGDPLNNSATAGAETAADYQGGDLKGITLKIADGYFSDLGVNLLILSSPLDGANTSETRGDGHVGSAFYGAWPVSMNQTESRFGSDQDLKDLVQEAHRKGLKVIVEFEINHVHSSSGLYTEHPEWFSPYKLLGSAEMPWDASDAVRGWLASYLPDIDYSQSVVRNAVKQGMRELVTQTGVDGVVLMNAKWVDKSFLTDLRQSDCTMVLADVYEGDASVLAGYPTSLNGMLDYPLRGQLVEKLMMRSSNLTDLGDFLSQNEERYEGTMLNFVGSSYFGRPIHFAEDSPLWGNAWDGGGDRAWSNQPVAPTGSAFERIATAYTVLFTLPGLPVLYYGDEIGLAGGGNPDNMRSMQWSGNSASQLALRTHLQSLTEIRGAHPALRTGRLSVLAASTHTLLYSLSNAQETVYVAANRSDVAQTTAGIPASTYKSLFDGSAISVDPSLTIPPRKALIFQ